MPLQKNRFSSNSKNEGDKEKAYDWIIMQFLW